jgi:AhpD family alkylhydroperoxidase
MLAVTAVNGCKMCFFGHTTMALKSGVSEEEIHELMDSSFENSPPNEVLALTFAQHYAETGGNPSSEAFQKLVSHYGYPKACDILVYIQMISFGNLMGNTIEAFEARQQGLVVENGSPLLEGFFAFFAKPVFKILRRTSANQIGQQLLQSIDSL